MEWPDPVWQFWYVSAPLNRNQEALDDFSAALERLRGNLLIDYKQLGLIYKLYSVEVWVCLRASALVHTRRGCTGTHNVHMHKCMYVHMCTYLHMYMCFLLFLWCGTYVRMYVCSYACAYVQRTYACSHVHILQHHYILYTYVCASVRMCMWCPDLDVCTSMIISGPHYCLLSVPCSLPSVLSPPFPVSSHLLCFLFPTAPLSHLPDPPSPPLLPPPSLLPMLSPPWSLLSPLILPSPPPSPPVMPGTPEYGLCPSAVGSREGGYSETGGGVQGLAGDRGTAARGGKDSTGRSKGVCFMHVLFAVSLCMFCEEQMEDESLRTRPTYVHSCLTWSCCVYVYTPWRCVYS